MGFVADQRQGRELVSGQARSGLGDVTLEEPLHYGMVGFLF